MNNTNKPKTIKYQLKPEIITDERVWEIKENLDKCGALKIKNLITISRALDKQIAKKPIHDYIVAETQGGNLFNRDIYVCNCGNIYISKSDKFCPKCGQKIDWSVEE